MKMQCPVCDEYYEAGPLEESDFKTHLLTLRPDYWTPEQVQEYIEEGYAE